MVKLKDKWSHRVDKAKIFLLMFVIMLSSQKIYVINSPDSVHPSKITDIAFADLTKEYNELFAFSTNLVDEYDSLYKLYVKSTQESFDLRNDVERLNVELEISDKHTRSLVFGIVGVGLLCVIEGILIGFCVAN